mmetsp:Transcript_6482/g.3671  ORF Transcript_6482/g.3671 Transcript_6482/m.3671 type:complete len:136 (+) Transcript_6482:255-662(+)
MPWNLVKGLEKIGDGVKNTPEMIFRDKTERRPRKQDRFVPSNVATGLGMGTISLVSGVVKGVSGVFTEPYKGAKKYGIRGGIKGFGKGIVGLVCKPVAGTLDLLTFTARGMTNMPKTIYTKIKKTIKKRKYKNSE